jgi:hypothetical protein
MAVNDICPRSAVVFIAQIITVLIIVITAALKLSLSDEDSSIWLVLLSSAVGFILPTPALKKKKIGQNTMAIEE